MDVSFLSMDYLYRHYCCCVRWRQIVFWGYLKLLKWVSQPDGAI